ncbi:MAG: hypothetical protein AMXMBFR59_38020 [Rhodanobacteraceae bacterium]
MRHCFGGALAVCFTLLLAACGGTGDAGPAAGGESAVPVPREARRGSAAAESVSCAEHYAQVRDAVLDTLRGEAAFPLIDLAARASIGSKGDAADDVLKRSCRSENRHLRKLRANAAAGTARTLAPSCVALVDYIDSRCLQPLAQRGEPLDRHCTTVLTGIADSASGMDTKLRDDGFCRSVRDSF